MGHLYSQGHEYGYDVTLTRRGTAPLGITDVTARKHSTQCSVNASASTATGTYQGKPVAGQAYVEQAGHWK
ncbi:hypothetical protein [Streptomyces sp. NPDC090445]|uniref:hypothetical protein n=1 Tax=Streptomyces sp. NPDC090445 TaxID=3365963 RepID=UPI003820FE3B